MTKHTVSRTAAQAILDDIKAVYAQYLMGASTGPTLRDHDHEELPAGSWSIDWEEGPEGWVFEYSQNTGQLGLLLEPINHVILGIHPA